MLNCPDCQSIQYPEHIQNCLICGTKLTSIPHSPEDDEYKISLKINFTIITCDECGTVHSYKGRKCNSCGTPLTNDDGSPFVLESVDPVVKTRREALSELTEMRDNMLNELKHITPSRPILDEEEYRLLFTGFTEQVTDGIEAIRDLLSSISFVDSDVTTDEFRLNILQLKTDYTSLFETTKNILGLTPPSTWTTLHNALSSTVKQAFRSYLHIFDVLLTEDFNQAQELMSHINNLLDEAGHTLESLSTIVVAGKSLRYGQTLNLSEAIASQAYEDVDISSWQEKGWNYFKDLFSRDIKEMPHGAGFQLAICAIIVESFNSPSLLKERSKVISDLFRRADTTDCLSLKAITTQLEDDVLHASRLLFDIGLQFLATDFSKLHSQQKFNIAIHAYQRMSEGAFKHLLTILLFCERLNEGANPNYYEISKTGFGPKVRRYRPRQPKSLADSSEPLIAELADDLVMYVRHADAHCDFRSQAGKIIIYERDHRTKQVIATHQYTEDEFVELIQKLLEAVFAILIGILVFQLEFYEDYLPANEDQLFDYEKSELCKYIFATQGIIVDTIEQMTTSDRTKPHLKIQVSLKEGVALSPNILGPPYAATVTIFPETTHLITELHDGSGNLMGKLTVPASHFQKFSGSDRAKQLVVLELAYKLLTKYADPPDLFNLEMTKDEIYYWHFLKGCIIYLNHILVDCYKIVSPEVIPAVEPIKALEQELTILQNILVTNKSPSAKYQSSHTQMVQATRIGKQFVRARRLAMRSKGGKKSKDFRSILGKAESLRENLLDFVIHTEQVKEGKNDFAL